MIRLFPALCLLCIANLAAAQMAVMRSGAHDGFDRLVLDMPTRTEWRTELRDGGASVVFEDAALRFDLDAAFARIGRARLQAISAPEGGGRLDLDFACACRLRAFWHGAKMLVLDIMDNSPTETSPQGRDGARMMSGMAQREGTNLSASRHSPASQTLVKNILQRVGPRQTEIPGEPPAPASRPELQTMNQTLREQLGRAASQGLITISAPRRPSLGQPTISNADEMKDANHTEQPSDVIAKPPEARSASATQPKLRARTSMDRDIRRMTPVEGGLDRSRSCPSEDFLDVRSWGGERSFGAEIGRLNGSIFGEFDRIDEAVAMKLARLYIHYGFGAEAHQLLDLLDPARPGVTTARELADVVDNVPHPGGTLADALHCGEPAVLWAILAMPELPQDRVFDHSALKRSFVALPETLRRSLGPVLVRRLVSAGHARTAKTVFGLIGEKRDRPGAENAFAKAALSKSTGEPAAADAALRHVEERNAKQSGAALAERLEAALSRAQPVTLADSQSAGALAFEHRGSPVGDRLAAVYIETLGASGAFDKAINEYDRLRPALGDETGLEVAAKLVEALLTTADDVTFLRHVMTDDLGSPNALPGSLVLGVADRLLGLDFVDEALRYADSQGFGDNDRAARLLRARIALAQGKATEAELEVVGLEGRDAEILRAKALEARGAYAAARDLFAKHDDAENADRAALRLGRSDAMTNAQRPVLREVAQALETDPDDTPSGDAETIEEGRDLLDRSTSMRDVFRRLLAEMPSPSSSD